MTPLSLYIHWPFCLSKCPYCDFNSHVRARIEEEHFLNALITEMNFWREKTGPRELQTIFFGGGTPSLMQSKTVAALLNAAQKNWSFTSDIEITLEANPTSSEAEKFQSFRDAGINRVSIGVQALNDEALKSLGRQHGAAEAIRVVEMAQKIFPRFSFDLIYARKNQTLGAWEAELKQALSLAKTHISLYQLTLEPGTLFAKEAITKGTVFQADEDTSAAMYELTQAVCADANLSFYEVSNHAAAGEECRHNLAYWHYDDYVGIGPGAHGRPSFPPSLRPSKHATQNIKSPEAWLRQVQEKKHGYEVCEALDADTTQREAFLMGLRLKTGLNKAAWKARFGTDLLAFVEAQKIRRAAEEGLITDTPSHLAATSSGMLKLTALTHYLLN
jgi:oxygen-independent coproporphyrinogen-3 oxidase